MTRFSIRTLLLAGVLAHGATAAWAAGDHDHAHGHQPLHGGVVVEAKDMDYELVARADRLQLYLRDHGKPVPVAGASARLVLLTGADKQEVALAPAGDRLEAAGTFRVAKGTKVVAQVQMAGKASSARFVLP